MPPLPITIKWQLCKAGGDALAWILAPLARICLSDCRLAAPCLCTQAHHTEDEALARSQWCSRIFFISRHLHALLKVGTDDVVVSVGSLVLEDPSRH